MNYGNIISYDIANGPGIRLSLFVSGCTNHCKGCFQPETWDFNYGKPYTQDTEDMIIQELSVPYYNGITILGGDPFEHQNQPDVERLVRRIRECCPHLNIWMYTGYTYDKDLVLGGKRFYKWTDSILDNIDVLVDGKFIEELKNIRLVFRGSENQRIIDMKKTREKGEIWFSSYMNGRNGR